MSESSSVPLLLLFVLRDCAAASALPAAPIVCPGTCRGLGGDAALPGGGGGGGETETVEAGSRFCSDPVHVAARVVGVRARCGCGAEEEQLEWRRSGEKERVVSDHTRRWVMLQTHNDTH